MIYYVTEIHNLYFSLVALLFKTNSERSFLLALLLWKKIKSKQNVRKIKGNDKN